MKPHYYNWINGIECKDVARHFNYNIGCVIKYLWRCGRKTADPLQDLYKARDYLNDEIAMLEEKQKRNN